MKGRMLRLCPVALAMAFGMEVALADGLYSAEGYHPLAADHRALKVGDNLTVVVTEITTATTDARTTSDKTGSVSGGINLHQLPQQGALNLNETFSGGRSTEHSGKLLARRTVVVPAED